MNVWTCGSMVWALRLPTTRGSCLNPCFSSPGYTGKPSVRTIVPSLTTVFVNCATVAISITSTAFDLANPTYSLFRLPLMNDTAYKHRSFVSTTTSFLPFSRGSNEQLVHFYQSRELILCIAFSHGMTDSLKHRPCGIVINAYMFRQQQSRITSLVWGNEEDREEPSLQRDLAFMKNCSSGGRIEMWACSALICSSGGNTRVKVGFATLVANHAFWPTHSYDMIFTSCFRWKSGEKVHEVKRLVRVCHDSTLPY